MINKIFLIDSEKSIIFNGKLRGFIEVLSRSFTIIKISQNHMDSIPVNETKSKSYLFIEPRQKLSCIFFKKIDLDKFNILFSCNHFMVTNPETKNFIKNNYQKIIFQVENLASLSSIKYYFEIPDKHLIKILIIPPVLDPTELIINLENILLTRKINNNIMLGGAIYIHQWYNPKSQGFWWQDKFKVNDYFPNRKLIYDYSIQFKVFNNYSRIIFQNDGFFRYMNIFFTIMKYDFWAKRKSNYYKLNLYDGFSSSSFFWGINDIFGVLPQICFQAMRAGCIIVGTNSITFKSLGFIDGLNYISIGSNFSIDNIEKSINRIYQLSSYEIRTLSINSSKLLEKIELDCKNRINELLNDSLICQ
jgi:hypothetical protein